MRLSRFAVLQLTLAVVTLCKAQEVVKILPVSSQMDVYRADGYDDGSDGTSPAVFTFAAARKQVIMFPSVTGTWSCGVDPLYGPDGSTATACQPHNISNPIGPFAGFDSTDFTGALSGVFLADALPANAPPPLRFYVSDGSYGGIATDFEYVRPQIGQIFFIGDGLTGTGTGSHQVFAVPPTATHLYLGYIDSNDNALPGGFSNNLGALTVAVRLSPVP